MANASRLYAYLDLPGNRLIWTPENTNSSGIVLYGSNFTDIVPMATMAVSALCLLAFIVLVFMACVIRCTRGSALLFLLWYCGWLPLLWMTGFFILDLANRFFHELEIVVPIFYIAIDVPMGSSSSIADGLLMLWLLNNSPVNTLGRGEMRKVGMVLIVIAFCLLTGATKGVQIWTVITQASPPTKDTAALKDDKSIGSVYYYTSLATAAIGVMLLFAICYALFAVAFIRRFPSTNALRKRLIWLVSIIAGAFLVRSLVMFVFTLVYSQYGGTASYAVQLVYLAFYGFLSVAIFSCIILVAHAARKDEGFLLTAHDYVEDDKVH